MSVGKAESQPLVSVAIPCHNYAAFVGEAIESALGQTHRAIEVVVVDDGSTDGSTDAARAYPVTVIRQPNSGVVAAANRAIRATYGPFVLRLDADDRLTPSYVEQTLAALEETPGAHFAYTRVAYFGAQTGSYPVEPFDPETLAERNYVHASALMRRSAFETVGGYRENMADARYEDWDLWLAFAEQGLAGVLVDEPLLEYRQHAGPSRGQLRLKSLRSILHEAQVARRLQANHPRLLAPSSLRRRLARLPGRLARGEVSMRFALLLAFFYGAMLAPPHPRDASARVPQVRST